MTYNTLVGYEMMIQGHVLTAMTRACEANNWYIASAWARAFADLLDIPLEKYPQSPGNIKNRAEFNIAWENYFFNFLHVLFPAITERIKEIRKNYRPNKDIPVVN